jgi:4-hydroxybenzoate polyprenyltransferase
LRSDKGLPYFLSDGLAPSSAHRRRRPLAAITLKAQPERRCEIMPTVGPWLNLLRFDEYGPFFLLCVLAGSMVGGQLGGGVILLMLFVAAFSASAFVENDVVDVEEDLRKSESRNPIAAGLISRGSGIAVFTVLAGLSVATLLLLNPQAILMGLLAFGLYWGYSWGLNLKAIPAVDVAVHGAVPALFVVMGAAVAGQVSYFSVLVALIVFVCAAMSGLLQQVRDLGADRTSRRTTAMVLGMSGSVRVCMGLAIAAIIMFASLPLAGLLPIRYLLFAPAGYFLVKPLNDLRLSESSAREAIARIRNSGLALSVLLLAAYFIPA